LKKYFKNFSFKEIKKSILKKSLILGMPSAMQMLFEVTLFTAIWLSGSLGKKIAKLQIKSINPSIIYLLWWLWTSVTAMIRVSNTKDLNDLSNLLW
jgi:MATE family multidrug resistance protein